MNAASLAAIVPGVCAIGAAAVSMASAKSVARTGAENTRRLAAAEQAAKLEQQEREEARTRVAIEAQAYERARTSYERIVQELEGQLERNQRTVERVQDQLDRVLARLGEEQAVNSGLRDQIHTMRQQIDQLKHENEQFRRTVKEHQKTIATLVADLRRAGAAGLPPVPPTG